MEALLEERVKHYMCRKDAEIDYISYAVGCDREGPKAQWYVSQPV